MDNNNQPNINIPEQSPINSIPPSPKKLSNKIIVVSTLVLALAAIIYIIPKYWDVAGGGATIQTAPDSIKAGEVATVKFEVSVPGSKQSISGRYSDIFLYYQITGEDLLGQLTPKLISQDEKKQVYEFSIPTNKGVDGEITYSIELKLDGHANRIEGYKKIKIGESIASTNSNSFKTWDDGTGYIKGEVIERISGCEVDGACKLIVQTGDQKVALVYAEGDIQCLNTQAASWVNWGKNVNKGTVVKAYGAYKKLGSEQRLTFCDSKDYFILGADDPAPVGAYTEKFFDEVTGRMGENGAQVIEKVEVSNPKDGDKLGNAFVHYINWGYPLKENLTISLCNSSGCKIVASEVPNSGQFKWDMSIIPGIVLDEAYYFEVYPPGARERVGKSGTFVVVQSK